MREAGSSTWAVGVAAAVVLGLTGWAGVEITGTAQKVAALEAEVREVRSEVHDLRRTLLRRLDETDRKVDEVRRRPRKDQDAAPAPSP